MSPDFEPGSYFSRSGRDGVTRQYIVVEDGTGEKMKVPGGRTVNVVEDPTEEPSRPQALYRFFDAEGSLLYVGITNALLTRLSSHERTKPWWADVTTVTVEHYEDRDSVLLAETAAIVLEGPAHNAMRSVGQTPIKSFRIPEDVYRAARAKAAGRGDTLTAVVVEALKRYAKRKDR